MIEFFQNLYFQIPTVAYCEQPLDGLIKRPFYAAGNVVFILAGIIILTAYKKNPLSKPFGWITILIGMLSFLYDATYSFLFQVFDFTGMFIFATLLLLLNFKRIGLNVSKIYYWIIVFLGVAVFLIFGGQSAHVFFGILVLAVIFTEFVVKKNVSRKLWYIGIGSFFLGSIFWFLDLNQIFCDPSGIFNGRNLEHLFYAVAICFLYIYYSKQKHD